MFCSISPFYTLSQFVLLTIDKIEYKCSLAMCTCKDSTFKDLNFNYKNFNYKNFNYRNLKYSFSYQTDTVECPVEDIPFLDSLEPKMIETLIVDDRGLMDRRNATHKVMIKKYVPVYKYRPHQNARPNKISRPEHRPSHSLRPEKNAHHSNSRPSSQSERPSWNVQDHKYLPSPIAPTYPAIKNNQIHHHVLPIPTTIPTASSDPVRI